MKLVNNSVLAVYMMMVAMCGLTCALQTGAFEANIPLSWKNNQIKRVVDVTKSYVKDIYEIRAENVDAAPVREYVFPLAKAQSDDYSLILGTFGDKADNLLPVSVFNNKDDVDSDFNYLVAQFPAPIAPGSHVDFQLQFIYLRNLQPVPDQLDLNGIQSVVFKTFKYPVSPYSTEKFELRFSGTNGKVSDLDAGQDPLKQVSSNSKFVVFRPENEVNIEPFNVEYASFFFERNRPLAVAENLHRDVWISHWGDSVSFEEAYEVTNKVGKLKGGFSRLNWMQSAYQNQIGPHLLALDMLLPSNFREAYYVDLVGNVSTSKIIGNHLVLKPRYPIFGGWNYNFTIGWSNNLRDFVRKSADEKETYLAKVPLLNGHQDMSYNAVKLAFYLPEGAQLVDIATPIPYENYTVTTEKSYLDFTGHTKVTVHYKNLVDDFRSSDVIIKYSYSLNDYYKKPVLIGSFLFVALISYLLLTKIDIAIDARKKI